MRLGVLLDRGLDDLGAGAVVAEVDDLGAGGLEDPAQDVDGRVMPVEEGGGRHKPHLVDGFVGHQRLPGLRYPRIL